MTTRGLDATQGELSKGQIDSQRPHRAALPEETNMREFVAIQAYCTNLSLTPCGHTSVRDDTYFVAQCVTDLDHAACFCAQFGGELI